MVRNTSLICLFIILSLFYERGQGNSRQSNGFNISPTIQDLPVSNGLGSGWVNIQSEKLVGLRTELYGYENEYETTHNWCYDSYFGVYQQNSDGSVNGDWLPESSLNASFSYVDGTSIVSLKYQQLFTNLDVSSYFFLPFTADSSIFTMLINIQNTDQSERTFLIHSLMNFILGSSSESISWKVDSQTGRGYYVELGNDFQAVYYPLPSSSTSELIYSASPFDVYNNGRSYWQYNTTDSGFLSSVTPGFQWKTKIQGNQSQWFGFVIQLGAYDLVDINNFLSSFQNPTAQDIYNSEVQWWSTWHSQETTPVQTGEYFDDRLFRQSTTVLKMAQCRKSGISNGQILASLPPGMWDIGWVRDGAYSCMALSVSNHINEARSFLNFLKASDVGYYKSFWYNGQDRGVGVDYGVSVCRYYGNGTEWSDGDSDPNIELDGYGLILIAIDTWFNQSKDLSQIQVWWDWIQTLVNPIVDNIDPNNFVVIAESGIWERHLSGARQFSDTTATALAGLNAACHLSIELTGSCPTEWSSVQQKMVQGFTNTFTQLGWVKGEAEDDEIDGSSIESFNLKTGLVNYNDLGLWINTTNMLTEKLAFSSNRTWGYKRRETGEWYDVQEWVFVDLRIAAAQRTLFKQTNDKNNNNNNNNNNVLRQSYSSETESWLLEQARANAYVLPELFDENGYAGAIPMAGFGAGAWILLQQIQYQ